MFNTQNYFLDQEFQSTKNLFEIFQKEQKEKNLNQFENPNQKKNETKNLKKKKEIKRILEKNSLYEILQENQFSSENKIGNSLKKIGEKIHPDKCLENGSERAFKKLVIAGSILSDSNKKLKYSQNQNINLFSQTNQALELFPEEFNPRFNPRNYFNNFPKLEKKRKEERKKKLQDKILFGFLISLMILLLIFPIYSKFQKK